MPAWPVWIVRPISRHSSAGTSTSPSIKHSRESACELTRTLPPFCLARSLMTALTANTSEPTGPAEFVIRRVGVVGLGHMGHAFAVNLVEDGHQVFVYDRDPMRAAAVTGARAAAQLADLAACDVVVISLPDDDTLAAGALGPVG